MLTNHEAPPNQIDYRKKLVDECKLNPEIVAQLGQGIFHDPERIYKILSSDKLKILIKRKFPIINDSKDIFSPLFHKKLPNAASPLLSDDLQYIGYFDNCELLQDALAQKQLTLVDDLSHPSSFDLSVVIKCILVTSSFQCFKLLLPVFPNHIKNCLDFAFHNISTNEESNLEFILFFVKWLAKKGFPKTCHDNLSYYLMLNSHFLPNTELANIDGLKNKLELELKNPNGLLSNYLRGVQDKKENKAEHALQPLSDTQKATLIIALLTNDGDTIHKMLAPVLALLPNFDKYESLKFIATSKRSALMFGQTPNSTVRCLISAILDYRSEDPGIVFRSQVKILEMAMQRIPDTLMTIGFKLYICQKLYTPPEECWSGTRFPVRVRYYELPKVAQFSFLGNISQEKFMTVLKQPIDTSEFIVLTLGWLQTTNQTPQDLSKLRSHYWNLEYDEALKMITSMCQSDTPIAKLILEKIKQLCQINYARNYARRFFETQVSQIYLEIHINFDSMNKILVEMMGTSAANFVEVDSAFTTLLSLSTREAQAKKHAATYFPKKLETPDKIKPGLSRHRDEREGNASVHFIFSRNKGMMTANQPSIDISEHTLINRVPDKYELIDSKNIPEKVNRAAYVGGVSGHFFGMLFLFEEYMEKHAKDPELNTDINNFVKTAMACYASRGSHSFYEMMVVLNDEEAQKIFRPFGVKLDLSFSDDVIKQATRATQEYTLTLCLKRAVNDKLEAAEQKSIVMKP